MSLAQRSRLDILAAIGDPAVHVVSFDVFDTLLRRRVMDPDHVFWLVEQTLLQRGYGQGWVRHFGHARVHAWHLALRRAQLDGRQDTSFAEIYELLGSVLPGARPRLAEIAALELDLERAMLEAYPYGVGFFEEALSAGKRIILCSDQYLPKRFIEDQLKASGVAGYDHFYLSGVLGALKFTGALYDTIAVRLGVAREHILHIGDTEETDFLMANRRGLRAKLIPKSADLAEHGARQSAVTRHPSLASVASAMFLHREADDAGDKSDRGSAVCGNYLEYLGYALLGPLLVGLARWLADRLASGEIERLWFLSRDGEGLAKVFALLYPGLSARVEYVYASRRLLAYSTGELTPAEVFRHFCHIDKPETRARDFLETALGGVTVSDIGAEFGDGETLGLPGVRERVVHEIQRIIDRGDMAASSRAQTIHAYYRSKLCGAQRLGIFDVGWRGNLQRALDRALSEDSVDIKGYYLGHIFEDEFLKESVDCESFAFDLNFPNEVYNDIVSCLWVTEFLFASTHPSIVDLAEEAGGYRPVFEAPTPAKESLKAAGRLLQEAAIRFVGEGIAWNRELLLELADREQLVQTLREFVARPSQDDASAFAAEKAVIGIDELDGDPLVVPIDTTGGAEAVRRAFGASAWKAGFRAALGEAAFRAAFEPPGVHMRRRLGRILRRIPMLWRVVQAARDALCGSTS